MVSFLVRRFARMWLVYAVVTLVFVVMSYSRHCFDDAHNVSAPAEALVPSRGRDAPGADVVIAKKA